MPKELKRRVMHLIRENRTSPEEMAQVNVLLGENNANAVHEFAQTAGFALSDVDIIAGQGQVSRDEYISSNDNLDLLSL